jgi:hypothetical protein
MFEKTETYVYFFVSPQLCRLTRRLFFFFRFMKDVDQFNETSVSAFVTAGGVIFLLLHKKKNYSQYRMFFEKVHELFVKVPLYLRFSLSLFFFNILSNHKSFLSSFTGHYESILRTPHSDQVQRFRSTCETICEAIYFLIIHIASTTTHHTPKRAMYAYSYIYIERRAAQYTHTHAHVYYSYLCFLKIRTNEPIIIFTYPILLLLFLYVRTSVFVCVLCVYVMYTYVMMLYMHDFCVRRTSVVN